MAVGDTTDTFDDALANERLDVDRTVLQQFDRYRNDLGAVLEHVQADSAERRIESAGLGVLGQDLTLFAGSIRRWEAQRVALGSVQDLGHRAHAAEQFEGVDQAGRHSGRDGVATLGPGGGAHRIEELGGLLVGETALTATGPGVEDADIREQVFGVALARLLVAIAPLVEVLLGGEVQHLLLTLDPAIEIGDITGEGVVLGLVLGRPGFILGLVQQLAGFDGQAITALAHCLNGHNFSPDAKKPALGGLDLRDGARPTARFFPTAKGDAQGLRD
ncbi:hypothetical protein D3C81_1220660 [compost metagenome]